MTISIYCKLSTIILPKTEEALNNSYFSCFIVKRVLGRTICVIKKLQSLLSSKDYSKYWFLTTALSPWLKRKPFVSWEATRAHTHLKLRYLWRGRVLSKLKLVVGGSCLTCVRTYVRFPFITISGTIFSDMLGLYAYYTYVRTVCRYVVHAFSQALGMRTKI